MFTFISKFWKGKKETEVNLQRTYLSIAFRHLPPNSARIGHAATEGALFISAQLSTDAVRALRKVWILIRLWKQRRVLVPNMSTHIRGH